MVQNALRQRTKKQSRYDSTIKIVENDNIPAPSSIFDMIIDGQYLQTVSNRLAEEHAETSNASKVVQAARSYLNIPKRSWIQPTLEQIHSCTSSMAGTSPTRDDSQRVKKNIERVDS